MDYREINLGYKIPKAGEFGEIIRIKIIQQDRLDLWPNNFQYFERGRYEPISPVDCGFLRPEDNISELVQSLFDDFFVGAHDEYTDPRGAMLELYASIETMKRRFIDKDELPRLKKLLEKYLPSEYIPKFLKEDNQIITKKQWWNYNEFWGDRSRNLGTHMYYKCPVCGNDNFILVKDSSDARASWDIESKMKIYGCTKCYLLLHFCEEAVWDALDVEEENNRINGEIENMENAIDLLKKQKLQLEDKLKDAKSEKDIADIKKQIEIDVEWKIHSFEKEIKTLKDGYEDSESLAPYSNIPKRFELYDETFDRLFTNIEELKKEIESLVKKIEKK